MLNALSTDCRRPIHSIVVLHIQRLSWLLPIDQAIQLEASVSKRRHKQELRRSPHVCLLVRKAMNVQLRKHCPRLRQ